MVSCTSCYSWKLCGGLSTASEEILPCNGRMDNRCVANLVCRGCNPVTAVAIMAALGRAAADTVADAAGDGKGGGTQQ